MIYWSLWSYGSSCSIKWPSVWTQISFQQLKVDSYFLFFLSGAARRWHLLRLEITLLIALPYLKMCVNKPPCKHAHGPAWQVIAVLWLRVRISFLFFKTDFIKLTKGMGEGLATFKASTPQQIQYYKCCTCTGIK